MAARAAGAVGIDFGTTNSSVAYVDRDGVKLVHFPTNAGETTSFRSLLYFQRRSGGRASQVAVWTGPAAIEHYLARDNFDDAIQGRLIQSLKSHLSDRTLTGTEIFGRRYLFDELVIRILRDLRSSASELLGFEVTNVVAGRPVVFVGARSDADNKFAQERLRGCFLQAGFQEVSFLMEPVAAALANIAHAGEEEIVLIGDFGGGTTDFSLLRLDPTKANAPRVLATSGIGIAGDALDARIVRKLVSPALGSESASRSLGKMLPALPAWIFRNLERWHTLSFLRNHEVREMLRTAEKRALEPEKIVALRTLIEHDLGYQLHQAVQTLKVRLSALDHAVFSLDTEALSLHASVSRADFNGWIEPELTHMEAGLEEVFATSGISYAAVDRVILTGGTSLVPAVREIFVSRFGEARIHSGEVFTSVAQGLAQSAADEEM